MDLIIIKIKAIANEKCDVLVPQNNKANILSI